MIQNAHIFISHASADVRFARLIAENLQSVRVPFWLAPDSLPPGGEYATSITHAILNAMSLFVIVTPRSNASREVLKEVELANRATVPILAIVVGPDTEPSGGLQYHLSANQWVRVSTDVGLDEAWPAIQTFLRSISIRSEGRAAWAPSTAAFPISRFEYKPERGVRENNPSLDAQKSLPQGSRVGSYTIESLLHKSELGFVYKANSGQMARGFALKEFFPVKFAERDAKGALRWLDRRASGTVRLLRERFETEFAHRTKLSKAGFIGARERVTSNNTVYLAYQFQPGTTLREMLELKPQGFSAAEALDLLRSLLDRLSELHDVGIVHGDVSPGNVLFRELEPPTLIDFGACHIIGDKRSRPKGFTPGFSAPELALLPEKGGLIGPETDLYSAAAIAFLLISGETPEIANVPGRLDALAREKFVPWYFVSAVGWALSRYPGKRPPDARTLQRLLSAGEAP